MQLARQLRRLIVSNRTQQQGKFQRQYARDENVLSNQLEFRNYNIAINKQKFDLYFYIFHPQISKKSPTTYEIKRNSTVLAMTFVDKSGEQSDEENWINRKSFALKFADVGKLVYVQPGKGHSAKITIPRRESQLVTSSKEIEITDKVDQQTLQIKLSHITRKIEGNQVEQRELEHPSSYSLSYLDYKLYHELIKASLLEMSGWKIQMQLQRQQYLKQIKSSRIDEGLDNISASKIISRTSQQTSSQNRNKFDN